MSIQYESFKKRNPKCEDNPKQREAFKVALEVGMMFHLNCADIDTLAKLSTDSISAIKKMLFITRKYNNIRDVLSDFLEMDKLREDVKKNRDDIFECELSVNRLI